MVAIAFMKHSFESFITAIKFWRASLSSFASFIKILSLSAADKFFSRCLHLLSISLTTEFSAGFLLSATITLVLPVGSTFSS